MSWLGTWEQIKNPNFKVVEFDHFKTQPNCHTSDERITGGRK
jgi:hypothetical protein